MMKKYLILLCCLYSGFLGASREGEALKALLQPITSMKAKFQQTVSNEKGKVLQQSKGELWLNKPRQFRWEIKGEAARVIVSDGKKIWDYDEDLSQVNIRALGKEESKLPVFLLSGEVDALDQDFEIKQCTPANDACYELIPKESQETGIFQRIYLRFKNRELVELETLDQLGQRTVFKFKDVEMNKTIPPTRFQFVPPKGVDVIGKE